MKTVGFKSFIFHSYRLSSRNPFICHSYANEGGGGPLFSWNLLKISVLFKIHPVRSTNVKPCGISKLPTPICPQRDCNVSIVSIGLTSTHNPFDAYAKPNAWLKNSPTKPRPEEWGFGPNIKGLRIKALTSEEATLFARPSEVTGRVHATCPTSRFL